MTCPGFQLLKISYSRVVCCVIFYMLAAAVEGISKIDMTTGAKGETPLEANVTDGERILCLDGGGCKGLIIIEILEHLEKISGRRIVKLFDWIVATSAGAIIALSLVYRTSLSTATLLNSFNYKYYCYYCAFLQLLFFSGQNSSRDEAAGFQDG